MNNGSNIYRSRMSRSPSRQRRQRQGGGGMLQTTSRNIHNHPKGRSHSPSKTPDKSEAVRQKFDIIQERSNVLTSKLIEAHQEKNNYETQLKRLVHNRDVLKDHIRKCAIKVKDKHGHLYASLNGMIHSSSNSSSTPSKGKSHRTANHNNAKPTNVGSSSSSRSKLVNLKHGRNRVDAYNPLKEFIAKEAKLVKCFEGRKNQVLVKQSLALKAKEEFKARVNKRRFQLHGDTVNHLALQDRLICITDEMKSILAEGENVEETIKSLRRQMKEYERLQFVAQEEFVLQIVQSDAKIAKHTHRVQDGLKRAAIELTEKAKKAGEEAKNNPVRGDGDGEDMSTANFSSGNSVFFGERTTLEGDHDQTTPRNDVVELNKKIERYEERIGNSTEEIRVTTNAIEDWNMALHDLTFWVKQQAADDDDDEKSANEESKDKKKDASREVTTEDASVTKKSPNEDKTNDIEQSDNEEDLNKNDEEEEEQKLIDAVVASLQNQGNIKDTLISYTQSLTLQTEQFEYQEEELKVVKKEHEMKLDEMKYELDHETINLKTSKEECDLLKSEMERQTEYINHLNEIIQGLATTLRIQNVANGNHENVFGTATSNGSSVLPSDEADKNDEQKMLTFSFNNNHSFGTEETGISSTNNEETSTNQTQMSATMPEVLHSICQRAIFAKEHYASGGGILRNKKHRAGRGNRRRRRKVLWRTDDSQTTPGKEDDKTPNKRNTGHSSHNRTNMDGVNKDYLLMNSSPGKTEKQATFNSSSLPEARDVSDDADWTITSSSKADLESDTAPSRDTATSGKIVVSPSKPGHDISGNNEDDDDKSLPLADEVMSNRKNNDDDNEECLLEKEFEEEVGDSFSVAGALGDDEFTHEHDNTTDNKYHEDSSDEIDGYDESQSIRFDESQSFHEDSSDSNNNNHSDANSRSMKLLGISNSNKINNDDTNTVMSISSDGSDEEDDSSDDEMIQIDNKTRRITVLKRPPTTTKSRGGTPTKHQGHTGGRGNSVGTSSEHFNSPRRYGSGSVGQQRTAASAASSPSRRVSSFGMQPSSSATGGSSSSNTYGNHGTPGGRKTLTRHHTTPISIRPRSPTTPMGKSGVQSNKKNTPSSSSGKLRRVSTLDHI